MGIFFWYVRALQVIYFMHLVTQIAIDEFSVSNRGPIFNMRYSTHYNLTVMSRQRHCLNENDVDSRDISIVPNLRWK